MKGLFYKEGRCLWQYGKSYILLVVIFFGLTFLNKGGGGANPLWLLYPVFFVGSLPASLLSADERDGWLAYCDTLPIGRRQLVAAKYVTSAVLTALIITLVLLISALTGQPTVAGGTAVPLSMNDVELQKSNIIMATCGVLMASESVRGVLTVLPILPVIIITLAIFVGSWALSVKWFKAREL